MSFLHRRSHEIRVAIAQKQVIVIRHERPRVAAAAGFIDILSQKPQEERAIVVVGFLTKNARSDSANGSPNTADPLFHTVEPENSETDPITSSCRTKASELRFHEEPGPVPWSSAR